jgi:hypothetical protein
MSTITKQIATTKTLKLKSVTEDVVFDIPAGHNLVLPERTDFTNVESAISGLVDLSGKQDVNAKLTDISGLNPSSDDLLYWNGTHVAASSKANLNIQPLSSKLSDIAGLAGTEGKVLKFNGSGEIVEADDSGGTSYTFNAPLNEAAGDVTFDDTGFLKSADLGVTVQAYNANLLQSSDIGSTVQAYDATILKSSDIGTSVQAYSADILTTSDIGNVEGGVQACSAKLNSISAASTSEGSVLRWSDAEGGYVSGTAMVYNSKLNDIAGITSDATFLYYNGDNIVPKSASETVTLLGVEPYDPNILRQSSIGVDVQAQSSKLSDVSNLAPSNNDLIYWDGTNLTSASKETLGLQSSLTFAQPMSVTDGEVSLHSKVKKIYDLNYDHGDFLRWYDSGGTTEWSKRSSAQVLDDINAQARHPRLTSISQLAGTENKYLKIGSDGNVVESDGSGSYTFNAPLSESGGEVDLDDSNYAKLDASNTFAGVIQQQNSGQTSFSYTKVFDHSVTSNYLTEFTLCQIPVDPAVVHYVEARVCAVGHNGATTKRVLTAHVCNSNQTFSQSNEIDGNAGLYALNLGKCEFDVDSNFLRVRVVGVDNMNTRYHVCMVVDGVANISA